MDGISDIALREAARQALHDINGAMALLLFGSRARGDAKPDSDWDIAVVTAGSDRDWVRRGTVRFPPRPAAFDGLPGEISVLAIPFETLRAKRNAAGGELVGKGEVAKDLVGLGRLQVGLLATRQPRRLDDLGRLGKRLENFGGPWIAGFSEGDFCGSERKKTQHSKESHLIVRHGQTLFHVV